ncbi:Na+/H+ antiporter subunit E [Simkania negevensis]|uniref:Na+/H+ antiporter subunit E n=1 Tax=Simkania negevensis TaxID=83561 RepID=A0ABS3ARG3_9BACT|nr:Na+/H+ antiporter subunit E [Simkania negevensis]
MKWAKRVFLLFCFIAVFLREFLKANLSLAYVVLFVKRSQVRSEIVSYDISDLSHFEAIALAQLITLTPGTIAASVDDACNEIKIHVVTTYGLSNDSISHIENGLKTALLRVTR